MGVVVRDGLAASTVSPLGFGSIRQAPREVGAPAGLGGGVEGRSFTGRGTTDAGKRDGEYGATATSHEGHGGKAASAHGHGPGHRGEHAKTFRGGLWAS